VLAWRWHGAALAVALALLLSGAPRAAVGGSADPGGLYRGRTSQGGSLSARIAPRGGFVASLHVKWRAACSSGATLEGATDQAQLAIDEQGGFRLRGEYSFKLAGSKRAQAIANQRGRLLDRSLRGEFRASATVRGRSGAVTDHCDTGALSYTARHAGH
jgi:hypothetical protein